MPRETATASHDEPHHCLIPAQECCGAPGLSRCRGWFGRRSTDGILRTDRAVLVLREDLVHGCRVTGRLLTAHTANAEESVVASLNERLEFAVYQAVQNWPDTCFMHERE